MVGCDDDAAVLSVDLRTDYAFGDEFASARTELGRERPPEEGPWPGARMQEASASLAGADLVAGTRIAELDFTPGRWWVRVTLFDATGRRVGGRRVVLSANGNYGLTAVITRSCETVDCSVTPETPECQGGACHDAECSPETLSLCAPGECTADGDCTASAACFEPACVLRACFDVAIPSRCAAGERCVSSVGCVPPDAVDAGAADGGFDAGAPDAGFDAGPPPPDLLLYVPFDDDPADGLDDLSSFGHRVYLEGPAPASVPGRVGNAVRFSRVAMAGTRYRVEDLGGDLETPGGFTVAFWMHPLLGGPDHVVVSKPAGGGSMNSWNFVFPMGTQFDLAMDDMTGFRSFLSTLGPPTGEWTHIAGTFDGSVLRLYRDGRFVSMISMGSPWFDGSEICIGADDDGGPPVARFNGMIDELRIYGRPLDAAEIAALPGM